MCDLISGWKSITANQITIDLWTRIIYFTGISLALWAPKVLRLVPVWAWCSRGSNALPQRRVHISWAADSSRKRCKRRRKYDVGSRDWRKFIELQVTVNIDLLNYLFIHVFPVRENVCSHVCVRRSMNENQGKLCVWMCERATEKRCERVCNCVCTW